MQRLTRFKEGVSEGNAIGDNRAEAACRRRKFYESTVSERQVPVEQNGDKV